MYAIYHHLRIFSHRTQIYRIASATLPENASATILDGWRLPARLSLTSYSFTAFFILAQSVFAHLWFLCLMSALWVLKIRKHSLFVHLNPIKQDPLGGAWLISKKTMNISNNRSVCKSVTERRLYINALLSVNPEIYFSNLHFCTGC